MAGPTNEQLQKQALELLKAQQEAYLEAVKAWRDAMAAGGSQPPWPELPQLDTLPNMAEMAEVLYEFAADLLKEQSRFMREIGKALTPGRRGGDSSAD